MQAVPTAILNKLDLRGAAEKEAVAWRNLLPPEPWCRHVAQSPGPFARWVSNRLSSGARNAPSAVVDARKANQAFRPVPVVGIAERIAMRALTDWILEGVDLPERGQDQYRAFVSGPISRAFPNGKVARLSQASIDYVVQADIAAFYQYVDHGVLLEELQVRTGKVEAARLLIELLGEIQGTTYGLPQLLAASDALSEVYIQSWSVTLLGRRPMYGGSTTTSESQQMVTAMLSRLLGEPEFRRHARWGSFSVTTRQALSGSPPTSGTISWEKSGIATWR